jgi:hypothetical protein
MPKLGSHLDFSQLEARNMTIQNSAAPSAPVKGQIYFDNASNTLLWWNGTAWISAVGGIYADATASSKGIVQLAGDLSGSAAAPVIATGAITSAKIADGTITDVDVAAANKDGITTLASMRTLGLGAQQAMPGNEPLNLITVPAAAVNMNNQNVNNVLDPTTAQQAATKNYVDTQGTNNLCEKQWCKAATTGNITLSGLQAIDGYTTIAGDRILVKNQTTPAQNGIYIAASGAWTRSNDMSTWAQAVDADVPVGPDSATQALTEWTMTGPSSGTIGTTNMTFSVLPSSVNIGVATPGSVLAANTTLNALATSNPASAAVGVNNQNITSVANPVNPQDAATKAYVDTTAQGLSAKSSVMCATTANITLSGLQAIDGYTTLANDRVLVKNQTTASQNGIYVAAAGAWTRALDNDAWTEFPAAYCWVDQGTTQADTGWICTNVPGGTLGTTNVTWVQFSGAAQITAGAGLQKAGNTISALTDNSTIDASGVGSSLEVRPNGITAAQIANGAINLGSPMVLGSSVLPVTNGGTGYNNVPSMRSGLSLTGIYRAQGPASAGTTISIPQTTHGLTGLRGIHVQVEDMTSNQVELPDVVIDGSGNVTITYAVSQAVNQKYVTLVG